MQMISVQNVCKSFGDTLVLDNISFSADPGEIYGLIGYNGVGKTTLMKIMAGIYRPDKGNVSAGDAPIYENTEKKKQCFFMTEEATYFEQSSLNEMRKFYKGYYENWSDKTFYGLVNIFEVDPQLKISRYSKGMQRQAALSLAFATHSKYMFLDEAFDGLDYSVRKTMRELLKYYAKAKEAILIVSSHNLSELENLADKIGMLNHGELVFDDSTKYMREKFCSCRFKKNTDVINLDRLNVQLEEDDGDSIYCVLECGKDEAYTYLRDRGVEDIAIRSVRLEEYFRTERKEKRIDWEEIFE